MRILLCGDWHANWQHAKGMIWLASARRCDAIVQLGDFGWWPHSAPERAFIDCVERAASRARLPVLWVDGNHEAFDDLESRPWREAEDGFSMCYRRPGRRDYLVWVRYLPRGARWECDGVRFLAFGGAFSIDRAGRTPGESWWPQETITDFQVSQAVMRARSEGPVDVMFTHDSPIARLTDLDRGLGDIADSAENRRQLRTVVEACKPRLLFHAHYHLDRTYGMTRPDGGATLCRCLHTDGAANGSYTLLDTSDIEYRAE